jgi:ribonuclease P protein component
MRLRFPKSVRLVRASEFALLKREGATFPGRNMVLSVVQRVQAGVPARIGIITSKRVGGAVVRNSVRRRLREIFRSARPLLRDDIWIVIVARSHAARASFQGLQAEWNHLARKSGILKPECSS